jgi:hypothetical protein
MIESVSLQIGLIIDHFTVSQFHIQAVCLDMASGSSVRRNMSGNSEKCIA